MGARLAITEAHIAVRDIHAACAFYTEKLGFTVAFLYGEPPFYGQVQRDEGRLAMRQVCEPVFAGDIREREELLSASFTLATAAEIASLFAAYDEAGVPFRQRLQRQPWGAQTFIVRDPDGNLILFAAPGA